MKWIHQCSLKSFNTFGVDVTADLFLEFSTEEELKEAIYEKKLPIPSVLVVGEGSNLLFLNPFRGCIVHPANLFIAIVEENKESVTLDVGAGVVWDDLVVFTIQNQWWGVENLSHIPGQTGAAAVQNIGAYGVEIAPFVQSVRTVDITTGKMRVFKGHECHYGYRHSVFKTTHFSRFVITSVRLQLSKLPQPQLQYLHLENEVRLRGGINLPNIRQTIIDIRNAKLPNPAVCGNAGSFFKNPILSPSQFEPLLQQNAQMPHFLLPDGNIKIPAAWLIEQCGWKGKIKGNVGVYEKQPLVIVNLGHASGQEIADFAAQIQYDVQKQFQIHLIPEVNYIP